MIRLHTTRGFTFVEMVVTLAILAIILAIAAPSFNSFLDQYRVKRAADTFSAVLINSKSEAIKRNKKIRTVITGGGATWCAGVTEEDTCDCTLTSGTNACQIDGANRVIRSTSFTGVKLIGPATSHIFRFTPQRGTVEGNETVELESANGSKVHVIVSPYGRIKLCSPSGAGNLGGYSVCPSS